MRPTALRSTPIFHPCAKPDVKLYQGREREETKEKNEREREREEKERERGRWKYHLLLYIHSNRIIPAVLTSGRGASFVVIIPRLRSHSIISVVDDLLSHLSFFAMFPFCKSFARCNWGGKWTVCYINDLGWYIYGLSDLKINRWSQYDQWTNSLTDLLSHGTEAIKLV